MVTTVIKTSLFDIKYYVIVEYMADTDYEVTRWLEAVMPEHAASSRPRSELDRVGNSADKGPAFKNISAEEAAEIDSYNEEYPTIARALYALIKLLDPSCHIKPEHIGVFNTVANTNMKSGMMYIKPNPADHDDKAFAALKRHFTPSSFS